MVDESLNIKCKISKDFKEALEETKPRRIQHIEAGGDPLEEVRRFKISATKRLNKVAEELGRSLSHCEVRGVIKRVSEEKMVFK